MVEDEKVISRLTILETLFDERWKSHDLNSEFHWKDINEKLEAIKQSIADLVTCKEYKAEVGGIRWHLAWLWASICGGAAAILAIFSMIIEKH